MASIGNSIKTADWKAEKHVPVIAAPESVKAGDAFDVSVAVGKEIPHPHTTAHFIERIELFFIEDGKYTAYALASASFSAHGASAEGADKSGTFADPSVTVKVRLPKSGVLKAVSYCNIHGLWESEKTITVA